MIKTRQCAADLSEWLNILFPRQNVRYIGHNNLYLGTNYIFTTKIFKFCTLATYITSNVNYKIYQIKYKRKSCEIFEDTPIKKQCLEDLAKIHSSLLKFYIAPLFMILNNITRWLNLTDVNISNNKIDVLPRKLGALHCLRRLNLSHNCLSRYSGWVWLKEARIKKTLRFLDISNNSLLELSEYIWSLNALVELKMSHNMLGHLPQGIEKVRNLSILDLSHNMLMYLPAGITNLQLQTIDISMNPLVVSRPNWINKIMFPSLIQFAAKVLHQYCRDKHIIFRWDKLNEYISRNKIDNCFYCGNICISPYVYVTQPLQPIFEIAAIVIRQTPEMPIVLNEFYYCFPDCSENYW